jgi:hypothetical protein
MADDWGRARVASIDARVASIDTAFVDQLFEKLLFKEVKGEKIEGRTTVNHAMKTARSAWNAISRAHPGLFPPRNPFEKMGLQSSSRETPHATFAELAAFFFQGDVLEDLQVRLRRSLRA